MTYTEPGTLLWALANAVGAKDIHERHERVTSRKEVEYEFEGSHSPQSALLLFPGAILTGDALRTGSLVLVLPFKYDAQSVLTFGLAPDTSVHRISPMWEHFNGSAV